MTVPNLYSNIFLPSKKKTTRLIHGKRLFSNSFGVWPCMISSLFIVFSGQHISCSTFQTVKRTTDTERRVKGAMVEVVINPISRVRHDYEPSEPARITKAPVLQPRKFNHPYKPYDVQIELMENIYKAINDNYKLGIFESPTGTGKTLSIICSTMTWLRNLKREKNAMVGDMDGDDDDDDEPEWVKQAYRDKVVKRIIEDAKKYEEHLVKMEKEKDKIGNKEYAAQQERKRRKKMIPQGKKAISQESTEYHMEDNELVPEDYYSDGDGPGTGSVGENLDKLNEEVQALLNNIEGNTATIKSERPSKLNECPSKIYFASRTHSQLSQFSEQLNLTRFPSSIPDIDEKTKYLPLGSRKQLCINPKVARLGDVTAINDACIDLQKNKTDDKTQSKGCPYKPKMNDSFTQDLVNNFRDLSFSGIHDIEDLHDIGDHYKVCPYYSLRESVDIAEIISLPYQLLLQKSSRESLGLSLRDSVIVIDEAHNLLDTITSLNSSSISFNELLSVRQALKMYTKKFSAKMNAGNRINIQKLIKMITSLAKFISKQIELKKVAPGTEVNPTDVFDGTSAELLNIHSLEKYLKTSKIAYKIDYYMKKLNSDDTKNSSFSSSSPLLFKVRDFLTCLSNPSYSGKLFFETDGNGNTSMKYLLLDPSEAFKDIVEESRCVILAGGTMEPISDFTKFLTPYLEQDKILHFNCDHIIPSSNLEVFPIGSNLSGNMTYEFSFDKRNNTNMINDLGESLLQIIETVPHGVVAFFPSYKYVDQVLGQWKQSQFQLYERINKLKKIFTEPKESTVEKTLEEFSKAIDEEGGAILFAVVGGKMSEGINFSGRLARCVIMIGLPFPNAFSGELIAKRKYIETKTIEAGGTRQDGLNNAKDFYENICMKAVNQSVGRAIRNINDYAVIYLIDQRYGKHNIQNKLSGWIGKRLYDKNPNLQLKPALEETKLFFSKKSM